jgi:hypothetical protein
VYWESVFVNLTQGLVELCDKDNSGGCSLTELVSSGKYVVKPILFFITETGSVDETTRFLDILPRRTVEALISLCDTNSSTNCTLDELGEMIVTHFDIFFKLLDSNGDG